MRRSVIIDLPEGEGCKLVVERGSEKFCRVLIQPETDGDYVLRLQLASGTDANSPGSKRDLDPTGKIGDINNDVRRDTHRVPGILNADRPVLDQGPRSFAHEHFTDWIAGIERQSSAVGLASLTAEEQTQPANRKART